MWHPAGLLRAPAESGFASKLELPGQHLSAVECSFLVHKDVELNIHKMKFRVVALLRIEGRCLMCGPDRDESNLL